MNLSTLSPVRGGFMKSVFVTEYDATKKIAHMDIVNEVDLEIFFAHF